MRGLTKSQLISELHRHTDPEEFSNTGAKEFVRNFGLGGVSAPEDDVMVAGGAVGVVEGEEVDTAGLSYILMEPNFWGGVGRVAVAVAVDGAAVVGASAVVVVAAGEVVAVAVVVEAKKSE